MPQNEKVRVRIAPSPTGNLHVGTARAALFNELFVRRHNGAFIVRIEDTDRQRSKKEYEENILDGLRWLGLTWDEGPDVGGGYGPYRQSERSETYKEHLQRLIDKKKAYYCYCAPSDKKVGERHQCTHSTEERVPKEGELFVIRLKVKPQEITFHDLIRGDITVHTDSFGGDFVIARSLEDPLYHLAVVIDDHEMHISHVIRGEDHLHNTVKHILIQQALGCKQPEYAHLPLLLDDQRRKLSKRSGETSLLAYKDVGYLPEAMLNYLALLGWNPKTDQEIFSHDELIKLFSLENVQKSGAIFSLTKLQSMNKHYIRSTSRAELYQRVREYFASQPEAKDRYDLSDETYWTAAMATEQERVSTLQELIEALDFYRPDWQPEYPTDMLVWEKSTLGATRELLQQTIEHLEVMPEGSFTQDNLQADLLEWVDSNNLGRADTLWPMRVALSGREHSPSPFEIAAVLGKGKTLERLQAAIKKLQ